MVRPGLKKIGWLLGTLFFACPILSAQSPPQLNESGQTVVEGRSTPYIIRRLPITSFPDLPSLLADLLNQRGCLIPQTYQAHHPENVIHASFEHPGSSDYAVLCSDKGTVTLLVYFSGAPTRLVALASAPETARLQVHDVTGVLGFDWGIDPASPAQVHQARSGMRPRPKSFDHDALVDTVIGHRTVYRFYLGNTWTVLDMPD
jgi:hypothetical protein